MSLNPKYGLPVFFYVLCVFASSFMVLGSETKQESQGFNMKLIPIHSTDSPFYQHNLTQEQRFKKLVEISNARFLHLESKARDKSSIATAQPPLYLQDVFLMVQVNVGNPQSSQFYLLLDTGSEITWIQSTECTACLKVKGGSFDRRKSTSYHTLSCGHPRCRGGTENCYRETDCGYEISYGYTGAYRTEGVIGLDYFNFLSDKPNVYTEVKMLFGVGLVNRLQFGPETTANNMAGVFGLSRGDYSFLYQYQLWYNNPSLQKFSYCLIPWVSPSSTTLKFGRNAYIPNDLPSQTTPFVKGFAKELYFLNCTGLSYAGTRFNLPQRVFRGGMIIDSGTPLSRLPREAYDVLVSRLVWLYDSGLKLDRWTGEGAFSNVCYLRPHGFNVFPNITVHLQGADWVVKPEGLFAIGDSFFCLSILPVESGQLSVLGGLLQTNTLFVHDVVNNKLSFAPEQCS